MKLNLSLLLGVAALALITLLGSADTVHAQTFNPNISACLDDAATEDNEPFADGDPEECDGDNTPGGLSDLTTGFDVGGEAKCDDAGDEDDDGLVNDGCPREGDAETDTQCENDVDDDGDGLINDGCPASQDVNFGALVSFIPLEWEITPGEEIPIGAVVGELTALATLGIIGAQCDNQLVVKFTMLNASIDITDTVPFEDSDDNGTQDAFEDKDNSGLQDSIERYPEFIPRIIGDVQPIRRAAGIQIVAGADVLLQFLVFEPGTLLIREIPSDEELGYPSMVFLQDVADPDRDPEPNPITDFCSPAISPTPSARTTPAPTPSIRTCWTPCARQPAPLLRFRMSQPATLTTVASSSSAIPPRPAPTPSPSAP